MPLSTQQQKIDWLLAHQDLWVGYPRGDGLAYQCDSRMWTIIAAMKEAGLVAMSTYPPDVALYNLIVEARKQRRDRARLGEITSREVTEAIENGGV